MEQEQLKSNYQGSKTTYQMVRQQVLERYGEAEAARYNPVSAHALPFRQWSEAGYRIKKGSRALKSITLIEVKDKSGEVIKKYPKKINLFYHLDVEKAPA